MVLELAESAPVCEASGLGGASALDFVRRNAGSDGRIPQSVVRSGELRVLACGPVRIREERISFLRASGQECGSFGKIVAALGGFDGRALADGEPAGRMSSLSDGRDWVRRGRGNWFGFFGLWAGMGSFGRIVTALDGFDGRALADGEPAGRMGSLSEGRDWVRRGRGNWFGFFGLGAGMGSFGKIMMALDGFDGRGLADGEPTGRMRSLSEGQDWVRRGRGNWFGFFGLGAGMGSFGRIVAALDGFDGRGSPMGSQPAGWVA